MQAAAGPHGYLGVVTLVARNGQVVDVQAQGHRDLARREPLRADAIFRIYSMSKPVATVAALMLMEQGLLDLDDPVAKHLPEFAPLRVFESGTADRPKLREPARPLTLRHLLTHTAGFGTGGNGSPAIEQASLLLNRAHPHGAANLQGFASRVAQAPLASDPGTRFAYDGVQIEVLGRVIEVVSGLSLDRCLQQQIFAPLKMVDTGFSVPAAQRGRVVDITTGAAGQLRLHSGPSAQTPGAPLNAYPSGAGGLYASAADYGRFCQMLLNGGTLDGVTLLQRRTVQMMTSDQLALMNPVPVLPARQLQPGESFGLGGSVLLDTPLRERPGAVGAYAWSGAAFTYFMIDPQASLLAILLAQHLHGDESDTLPKLKLPFFKLVYDALLP